VRPAWLLLVLCLLPACRYAYTRQGSDHFTRQKVELIAGETTAQQVAEALGPPQTVTSRGGNLIFHYRFRQSDLRSLIVRYFGGQWLQYRDEVEVDQSLIAVFGPQDRLRFVAPSQGSGDQFAVAPGTSLTPSEGAE